MLLKKYIVISAIFVTCMLIGCGTDENKSDVGQTTASESVDENQKNDDALEPDDNQQTDIVQADSEIADTQATADSVEYINPAGDTLETRINVPEGFSRISVPDDSLGAFLRSYKMKADKSPVLLFDGREKGNQGVHAAVFELPIEEEDLQQCADSIMRMLGEYYYSKQEYSKIKFSLGGGFIADFSKWSKGNGISLSGDKLVWTSSAGNDTSYESFKKFMRMVFAYSGTLNMDNDSSQIEISEIQVGDIFIKGGSPGHVVMIVDICENEAGQKAFLLAQGYMPAQEFHIIKNPMHEDNPWYYVDEIAYPLRTAEYTFDEGSLKRYKVVAN